MIKLEHIYKTYHAKGRLRVEALRDINLILPNKGMIFILGKSGSGKSTLLNIIGGLDNFDSGDIIFNNNRLSNFKNKHFDSYRNTYLGFIFQEYNIIEEFNVASNIALSMELQGKKPTNDDLNNILKAVDLYGFGARKPNELSGGQRQRIAIARALIKDPSVILADEPTGNLDSITGAQILETLKKLSREKLVIIVSHDRDSAEKYADRIIELADGIIINDRERCENNIDIPNIVYNNDEILVKNDYLLTVEDLNNINDYLKTHKNDNNISIKSSGYQSMSSFQPTNQVNLYNQIDNNNFESIKSHLSIKNSFVIGSSGLKYKKFRLVMTIILSFIAFGLFGLSDTISAFNKNRVELISIKRSNIDYASFTKMELDNSYDRPYYYSARLTTEDLTTLSNKFDQHFNGVINMSKYYPYANREDYYLPSYSSGGIYLNDEEMEANGFQLIYGRMPVADNEVCITKFAYTCFQKCGYYLSDEETIDIKNYNDIIDLKLSEYYYAFSEESDHIIVGIINTNDNYSKYLTNYEEDPLTNSEILYNAFLDMEFSSSLSYSYNNLLFVSKNYYDQVYNEMSSYSFAISYLPSNQQTLKEMIEETNSNAAVKFYMQNAVIFEVDLIESLLLGMKSVFNVLGIFFGIFAIILFSTFIASSLSYKRREIGILRAIGARGSDVFKIFFSESLIISGIIYVLSFATTLYISIKANNAIKNYLGLEIAIANFGVRQALLLLILAVGVAFIATLIPVGKYVRQKPIDAIRQK